MGEGAFAELTSNDASRLVAWGGCGDLGWVKSNTLATGSWIVPVVLLVDVKPNVDEEYC